MVLTLVPGLIITVIRPGPVEAERFRIQDDYREARGNGSAGVATLTSAGVTTAPCLPVRSPMG
jgi:hypothetical protein